MSAPAISDTELHFDDGVPGFSHLRRFVLVDVVDDGAFQELRSLDDPAVSFIVCHPWLFFPDYAPVISDNDQQELEIESAEEAIVFCPVTLDGARDRVFVNLFGPFLVNARTKRGRQLVLSDSDYPLRAPIDLLDA